jgi:hypothetical protein
MLQYALITSRFNCSVINKARSSATVDWHLGIKDGDESPYEPVLIANPPGTIYELAKSKSSVVIISLGINDAVSVAVDEFVRDFNTLINNCKVTGKKTYVVMPNSINSPEQSKLTTVAARITEISEQQGVVVIGNDLFDVPLNDHYHPTSAGYKTIASAVIQAIESDIVDIANHKVATGFYIAMFNKGPEKSGLDYWANELEVQPENHVAQSVVNATESYEGLMTDESFIYRIYNNLLNRVPDLPGLNYWLSEINKYDRGTVLNSVINVLESGNAPQVDKDTFQNKVSVGLANGYIYGNETKIDLAGVTSDFDSVATFSLQ